MSKAVSRFLYRYVFKRTSTFVLGMVICAPFFERAYDHLCEYIFETINEGRLWMHIKHKYEDPVREMLDKQDSTNKSEFESEETNDNDKGVKHDSTVQSEFNSKEANVDEKKID